MGCIFAEALNRAVLLKGKDSADQMRLIIMARGYPSDAFIHTIQNPHIVEFMAKFKDLKARPLSALLPTASEQGRQFFDYLMNYGLSWSIHQQIGIHV